MCLWSVAPTPYTLSPSPHEECGPIPTNHSAQTPFVGRIITATMEEISNRLRDLSSEQKYTVSQKTGPL